MFVEKLRADSVDPVAYAEIGGAQHAFDVFPAIRRAHVVRGAQRFLDGTSPGWRHIRPSPHYPTSRERI